MDLTSSKDVVFQGDFDYRLEKSVFFINIYDLLYSLATSAQSRNFVLPGPPAQLFSLVVPRRFLRNLICCCS